MRFLLCTKWSLVFTSAYPAVIVSFPDEELGSDLYLDGVVTVVDAKHALEQLQESAADR
jgi:G3E family GTPase